MHHCNLCGEGGIPPLDVYTILKLLPEARAPPFAPTIPGFDDPSAAASVRPPHPALEYC